MSFLRPSPNPEDFLTVSQLISILETMPASAQALIASDAGNLVILKSDVKLENNKVVIDCNNLDLD
jgi:hypothetical protein